MNYTIETITANDIMTFIFWGEVILLNEEQNNRSFSKYYIKSKTAPLTPNGWSSSNHTFTATKTIILRKGETIDRVIDENGNIYYEVTSLL